jgi:peptidylprolyl isomerase
MRFTVWKSDASLVQHVAAPTTVVLAVPKMIPGWGEAVQQMVVGAKQRAWVPETLTAGKSTLPMIIDTELVEIIEPPTTPPDVAAAPADAIKTKSGLASIVLRPGTGTVHPRRRDRVAVNYTGWTKDGHMFQTSVMKGEPVEFGLDQVIPGWTEGVQLMVEGEKRRFWIPSRMAYGNQKGMPQGNLVFDIELVEIK